jgi:hypothetical protein
VEIATAPPIDGGAETAGSLLFDSAWEIIFEWFTTAPEPISIFAIAGLVLWLGARRREPGLLLYLGIAAAMGALLLRLLVTVGDPGYLSRRHVLLPLFVTLPFTVAGIEATAAALARLLPPRARAFVFPCFFALIAAIHIPMSIASHRADQRTQRLAAEHILAHGGPGQRIYSTREKVGYYAGGQLVPIQAVNAEAALAAIAAEERAWLAFYREPTLEWFPGLDRHLAELGSDLHLERRWLEAESRDGRHLELYLWEKP